MNTRIIPMVVMLTSGMALAMLATHSAWAVLPPSASSLSQKQPVPVSTPTVESAVSSKQKPLGPALVLKLASSQSKAATMKPLVQGKSRLGLQTTLQNPNNPYGRSTFPIEPDEELIPVPQPSNTTRPAVVDEESAEPITPQQVQQPQQRPQPAPPIWPAQSTAAQPPAAKSPVLDPWRQAQAVPEGTTPALTPPDQDPNAAQSPGQSFNLQTQKGALARTYMFRQLTPKPYKSYTASVKALMASLHDTFVYLQGLNGELPDLQRLSAFQARVRVEWLAFQKRLPLDAPKFSSYKSIEVSVAELDSMSAYWINRNRVKRVYQGTLDQQYTDEQLFQTRITNLKNALANLEALAQTEREVVREIPYAY